MEQRFIRLEERLDAISLSLMELNNLSTENNVNLQEHMRRTELNEEQIKLLRELVELTKKDLEAKLSPVLVFIDRAKFFFTLLSFSGAVILGLEKLGFLDFVKHIN